MIYKKYVIEKGDYKAAHLLMREIFDKRIKNLDHQDFSTEKMHNQYLNLIESILS